MLVVDAGITLKAGRDDDLIEAELWPHEPAAAIGGAMRCSSMKD